MSMLHLKPIQRWASRRVRCRVEGVADRFALTFDDGPSPTNTPRVLDLLAEYGARATFFLLSGHASRHGALLRRQVDEGHELAVHGRWHAPPPLLPAMLMRANLRHSVATLRSVAGVVPLWYRAPFGVLTAGHARLVRREGLEPVLGDVYPEDAALPGADRIVRRTMARLQGGSVLILHDASVYADQSRSQTIVALRAILEAARERGLAAVSLRELAAAGSGPEAEAS